MAIEKLEFGAEIQFSLFKKYLASSNFNRLRNVLSLLRKTAKQLDARMGVHPDVTEAEESKESEESSTDNA